MAALESPARLRESYGRLPYRPRFASVSHL